MNKERSYITVTQWPHGELIQFYRDQIIGIIHAAKYREYLLKDGHKIRIDPTKGYEIGKGEI